MENSMQELLLAARVRELAVTLRKVAMGEYKRTIKRPQALDTASQLRQDIEWDERWDELSSAWLREHPLSEFIPKALAELERIAEFIKAPR